MRAGIDKRAMAALSSGHLATDLSGGALAALLPFLQDRFSLSYTLVAVLMLASTFSSSIVQPLFGLWSDRRGALWLLPAGVALAGVGVALASISPTYWLVVLFVVVSGLGTAAFHPEGSKFAAYASGRRRASGMSVFSIGGNLGFALGPVIATPLVIAFGLDGGLLLLVPALVVAVVLLAQRRYLAAFAPAGGSRRALEGENETRALVVLLAIIVFRSVAWFGLLTFVPLWEESLGHSKAHGNHLLSLMLLAGVVGTLFLGPLADRFGRRSVLLSSLLLAAPLTAAYVLVGGGVGAAALAGVGVCTVGTFGVTAVMSQEYMPRSIGMASGLSIGFSIGLGGLAAVGLGVLADGLDLEAALWATAAAPVAGLALCPLLPAVRRRRGLAPELAA